MGIRGEKFIIAFINEFLSATSFPQGKLFLFVKIWYACFSVNLAAEDQMRDSGDKKKSDCVLKLVWRRNILTASTIG
jgi:hypothetical protein